MSILDHYYQVLQNISDTAYKCGRNPADITLVAVSKEETWNEMAPIYQAGCRDFGESRVQEALPKIDTSPEDINWHFIGPLQKNKVRKAVEYFALIHSVDSYELAIKIAEEALQLDSVARILLEVNTSGEEAKHGFDPESVKYNFEKIMNLQGVKIEGFMTMAPFVDEEKLIRKCFARLWDIRDLIVMESRGKIELPYLSMGMSNDYQWAIQEGATILRIGTAIFK
jgi:pyridoxal phosphate enzyme (YggS family)